MFKKTYFTKNQIFKTYFPSRGNWLREGHLVLTEMYKGERLLALEVQKYTKIEPWEMYYRFVPLAGGDSNPDLIYLISSNCIKFHATYTVIGTRVNHQKFIRTVKRQRKKENLRISLHLVSSSCIGSIAYGVHTRPIPIVKT